MARRKKKVGDNDGDDVDYDGEETRGFQPSTPSSSTSTSSSSATIYSMPPLYDLAFGYRDYIEEVDFLLDAHGQYSQYSTPATTGTNPLRILELAAGPARHSLAALSEYPPSVVDSVVALDLSKEMVEYGLENARHELGDAGDAGDGGRRNDFTYLCGDMRTIPEVIEKHYTATDTIDSSGGGNGDGDGNDGSGSKLLFDTAWLLLGSMQHLLTNDDIIACLSSIHSVLHDGGTLVIELPHPRETFSMGECTRNGWTVPLVEGGGAGANYEDDDDDDDYDENEDYDEQDDEEENNDNGNNENEYGQLNIIWGEQDDIFNPVSQIRHFTVKMELTVNNPNDIPKDIAFIKMNQENGTKASVSQIVPLRLFTLQEIDALGRCAGFELVGTYGALDGDVSIEEEEEAFRMVCVLRKKRVGR